MSLTPELAQYISQARASGMSDDAIRTELLKAGWNVVDVNTALPSQAQIAQPQLKPQLPVNNGQKQDTKDTVDPVHHAPHKGIVLGVSAILTLLCLGGAVVYFWPEITSLVSTFSNKQVVEEEVPVTEEESKALVYRNEEYGFEIKYPENYVVGDNSNSGTTSTDIQVLVTRFEDGEPVMDDRVFVLKDRNWDGKTIETVLSSLYPNKPPPLYTLERSDLYIIAWFDEVTGQDLFKHAIIYDGSHNVALQFNPIAATNQKFVDQFVSDFRFFYPATTTDYKFVPDEETRYLGFYGEYALTDSKVYHKEYGEYIEIEGADPATFHLIGLCISVEKSSGTYAADKDHVYVGTKIIPEADPTTLRILGMYNVGGEVPARFTYSKDKDTAFSNCGEVIQGADVDTFEYVGDDKAKDKNHTYSQGEFDIYIDPPM